MFFILMIRSGLVRTKNGYSEGYQSNYNPLNRYEHQERPFVQGPDRPFVPYNSVVDPATEENTLKRPNDQPFYNAIFKKQATDPVRQVADILLRRLTQNVPGRTLTPSVPGIQPSMGGGGPGAGGPPGGGGGGGFGAGPAQGPAPGPDPGLMAGAAEARAGGGGPPGPPGGFDGLPTPTSPAQNLSDLRRAGGESQVQRLRGGASLENGEWQTVFTAVGDAISTGTKIGGALLPKNQLIKTALLQVLPEQMAEPILQFSRDLEDMSQKIVRKIEDYVVVPGAKLAAKPLKTGVANVVAGGSKRVYDAAARVAGLAQDTKLVYVTEGPVALYTGISQGDIPVDEV